MTPSLSWACDPPSGCWVHTDEIVTTLEVRLTWPTPMNDTTTPADGSWTLTVDGVPKPVSSQGWTSPTALAFINSAVDPAPTTVTLSYAGGDPGLRIASGGIVQAFDLGQIFQCV